MLIGQKLRELREGKRLSQGDIEKRTGLIRCYTSRVENGHTVPTVDTLEKYARALEIPLYRFFYDGAEPPAKLGLPLSEEKNWGEQGKDFQVFRKFIQLLARMQVRDRGLLVDLARRMAIRNSQRRGSRRPGRKRA
ncbi:MAG TPA: helix-turn-helix transcriptional regulator [Candidatus Limnocylindrales bacterium]|nr:helix-turn-helix transcriptional regulator [Candidatus Limnocylindrales bacterium]